MTETTTLIERLRDQANEIDKTIEMFGTGLTGPTPLGQLLRDAAAEIEASHLLLSAYRDLHESREPEASGGVAIEPEDGIKREYYACTVKGSNEIMLVSFAHIDGKLQERRTLFKDLYMAQLHSIGVAHALANLISHPKTINKGEQQ